MGKFWMLIDESFELISLTLTTQAVFAGVLAIPIVLYTFHGTRHRRAQCRG